MTWCIEGNIPTKKALKERVAAWLAQRNEPEHAPMTFGAVLAHRAPAARPVYAYDPSPFATGGIAPGTTKRVAVVGPGPYDRKWYAQVEVDHEYRVVKVVS